MEKMVGFVGMIIGSSVGGWLGEMMGLYGMVFLSAIGAGVGWYFGRKVVVDFLD